MDGATPEQIQRVMLRLAADIVKAAYEEAMRRHGLLPSTVALINGYAEEHLAALEEEN